MITLDKAEKLAIEYYSKGANPKSELVIDKAETIELEEGFILVVNEKKYLIDGNNDYRVSGISPIFIQKSDGAIFDPYMNRYISPKELIQMYKNAKSG